MRLSSSDVPLAAFVALAVLATVGPVEAQVSEVSAFSSLLAASGAALALGLAVFLWLLLQNANRALRAEAHRSSAVLEQSADGVIGLGKDMTIRLINPAARHMLGGISRDVPFDWPATARFHSHRTGEPLEAENAPLARALAGERVHREVFRFHRRPHEGEMRQLRVSCKDLSDDPSGAVLLITMTDTSRKPFPEEERQDAKGEVFSRLSLGIMNDFNNALATIAYAIDLSLKHTLPDKPTSFLMTALGTVERGQRLTDQMLRFAERGRAPHLPCAIQPMFDELKVLVATAIEPGVALSFDCDDPDLVLHCNQTHLETTLAEWLVERSGSLAGRAHPSRIMVHASAAGPSDLRANLEKLHGKEARFVEITVSDDGPHLPESIARGIDASGMPGPDKGDGLAQALNDARRFAQGVGGDIRLVSNGPEGVAISLVLPVEPGGTVPPPIWQARPERGAGETVFVVEDEASLLLMMQEELEDLGYRVISATSGKAALGLIEQGVEFDLVITDIVLPGEINGFDLAAKIQALRHRAGVLYMSGYTGFGKADMGTAQAPILKKPAPPAELARAVRSALVNRMN